MSLNTFSEMQDLALAAGVPLWKIVQRDDIMERDVTERESWEEMRRMYRAMRAADETYDGALRSRSGMAGGDGALLERFRAEEVYSKGQAVCAVPVKGGLTDEVAVVTDAPLRAAVPVGGVVEIARHVPDAVEAPVRAGDALGTVQLRCEGKVLAECGLVAAEDVEAGTFLQSVKRLLRRWLIRLQPSPTS